VVAGGVGGTRPGGGSAGTWVGASGAASWTPSPQASLAFVVRRRSPLRSTVPATATVAPPVTACLAGPEFTVV
jgi:hypothetical protein